jgi:hypothetical protein
LFETTPPVLVTESKEPFHEEVDEIFETYTIVKLFRDSAITVFSLSIFTMLVVELVFIGICDNSE